MPNMVQALIFSLLVLWPFSHSAKPSQSLLQPAYPGGDRLLGRSELERREKYMKMIYSQLREKHPLIQMIKGCLDFPKKRPDVQEVLHLLEEAKAEVGDALVDKNKLKTLQTLNETIQVCIRLH